MSDNAKLIWQVKNSKTGTVVSEWVSQIDAVNDKLRRDDKWSEVEPMEESPLVVEGIRRDDR